MRHSDAAWFSSVEMGHDGGLHGPHSLQDLAHVPDMLLVVLAHVQDDESTIVPHSGAGRAGAVCKAWLHIVQSPELWRRAHHLLRHQVRLLRAQDPTAPRRPRTAHSLFQQHRHRQEEHHHEQQQQQWQQHADRESSDDGGWSAWVASARKHAIAWRSLSAAERDQWDARALEDRRRYEAETARYAPWLQAGDDARCLLTQCRRLHAYLKARRKHHTVCTRPWISARAGHSLQPLPGQHCSLDGHGDHDEEAAAFFNALAVLEVHEGDDAPQIQEGAQGAPAG